MWLLFLFIGFVWFYYKSWFPYVSDIASGDNYLANSGVFGDSYGALNTLFSGFAFCGIIISIFLQSQELRETRQEVKGQKEALEKQNFEQTFFHLLSTHNQIVLSIDVVDQVKGEKTGRDCFGIFYQEFKGRYINKSKNSNHSDELEFIRDIYKELYTDIQEDTGHYFLFLYNMVKFVDENCTHKDPRFYTNLIRAQLSYDELGLLFYNCLSVVRENKFVPLIEKYALFKNIPIDYLADYHHLRYYERFAYEKKA